MLMAWDVLQFLQDTYKCDQILIPLFSALTDFFLLFPLSARPTQPPAHCQHSRCSDHTWDPLTDPFQHFWGEMKPLGAKQEVQQVKTLSVVGVIHLSAARVFTCAGSGSSASDCGRGMDKGWEQNFQQHCSARSWNG